MSSNTYSSYLTPDRRLRQLVTTSGRLLAVAGLTVILTLPLDAALRYPGGVVWGLLSIRELSCFHNGFRAYRALRLAADGELWLLNHHHEWLPAKVLNGSVVLRNLAWIRIRSPYGKRYAELLFGDGRQCREWRRLQVIWRHVGAAG